MTVATEYVQAQSDPASERYVFAYTIDIAHIRGAACQLLNRHWLITNGSGEVEEVRGAGVVGQQPRLTAGETFQYTSGAILKTPVGAMQGTYEFSDDEGRKFLVEIAPFSLSVASLVH